MVIVKLVNVPPTSRDRTATKVMIYVMRTMAGIKNLVSSIVIVVINQHKIPFDNFRCKRMCRQSL